MCEAIVSVKVRYLEVRKYVKIISESGEVREV